MSKNRNQQNQAKNDAPTEQSTNSVFIDQSGQQEGQQGASSEPEQEVVEKVEVIDKEASGAPVQQDEGQGTDGPGEVTGEEEAPAEVDLSVDGLQLSAFETRMAWIDQHGSTHEQYVKSVLKNYVEVCSKSIVLDKIATEQKRLWRMYSYIHAHPAEFNKLYNILIEFGREYKESVFNLHMFYRAQDGLTLGADEMQCFNNLRSLLMNTIESKNKRAVKALLDIRKIVDHPTIPEAVRGMYVAYYQ